MQRRGKGGENRREDGREGGKEEEEGRGANTQKKGWTKIRRKDGGTEGRQTQTRKERGGW
jgi:hypothetical protein